MKKYLFSFVAILCLIGCSNKYPDIILPPIISDHMVLQQNDHANLWGKCEPGTIVKIKADWGKSVNIRTDNNGDWRVSLNTPEYGGPYSIEIKAKKTVKMLKDIMIGEVWLCSGQSNMEMPLKGWPPNDTINNSAKEISEANYPNIRMFTVERQIALSPAETCSGTWDICSPETAPHFSATAYFFAKKLNEELNIPIGLLHSSWGGTPAEAWTDVKNLKNVAGFENVAQKLEDAEAEQQALSTFLDKLEKVDINTLGSEKPYGELNMTDSIYLAENTPLVKWEEINIPCLWEKKELPSFDGIVWMKKEFEVSSDLYPEGFQLHLGPIDDMDETYLNGVKIGELLESGMYQKERKYNIPAKALKRGKNTLLVKVIDTGGGGGIYGPEGPAVYKGDKKVVDLSGNWEFAPSAFYHNDKMCFFGEAESRYEHFPRINNPFNAHTPSVLFNGMIAPLQPYTIKGVIWYQGESNVGRGEQYKSLFPTLIKCWRDALGENSFPFYYVQIAPFNYGPGADSSVSLLREAQRETLKIKNTGMVVTMDIGNPNTIHPGNKQEVGRRLALWALYNDYGINIGEFSGPMVSNVNFKGKTVEVKFDHAQNGLVLTETDTTFFEVAGEEQIYYPAIPKVEGDKIILTAENVAKPKYIRYGWGDDVEPNLFNVEGLPASPFQAKK